jgi:hypothetical protein
MFKSLAASVAVASCLVFVPSSVGAVVNVGECGDYQVLKGRLAAEGQKFMWLGVLGSNSELIIHGTVTGRAWTELRKVDRADPHGRACVVYKGNPHRLSPTFNMTIRTPIPGSAASKGQ